MRLAVVATRASRGIDAPAVQVETHLAGGLPSVSIVGLPETAVRESKDRVRSALQTSRFEFPVGRITLNLAPADLPKEGGRFDLPIAIGILAASGQVPATALSGREFLAELALNGELRAVHGVLPAAIACARAGVELVVAPENADEAALPPGAKVVAARNLLDVCAHLRGEAVLPAHHANPVETAASTMPDLADVRGQAHARRALEIAAAGAHSLLMIGPPGSGKTMLASRLPGILPPLTAGEALEAAAVRSLRGPVPAALLAGARPYRAPHHSASASALVGGGSVPRPGEISLAHHGVLFLDELPEFDRHTLETLREPLESGTVHIARSARQVEFPARFQLVAAMNPCPCGFLGDPERGCGYTCERADRYRAKLSGPLLDRIDIHVEVTALPPATLTGRDAGEPSATVRSRVIAARERQLARQGCANAALDGRALLDAVALEDADRAFLVTALEKMRLSARATDRVLRVARTVADLAAEPRVGRSALLEALGLRALDRRAG
ncbi:MAG: YifB family Mg chelatase-like AAA ATPase [Gammaproteobacteria bacterium]